MALDWFLLYTHIVKTLHGTPPTPVKRLLLNFNRWKTLVFRCARSAALLSRGQLLLDSRPNWFLLYTHI